jgi:inositol polyphosphate-4-phosphatase
LSVTDPSELPLCEISLACDNLLCDGHGRPPNPVLIVHVYMAAEAVWIKYARTEVVEVGAIILELCCETVITCDA